jgi:hypothetical protein
MNYDARQPTHPTPRKIHMYVPCLPCIPYGYAEIPLFSCFFSTEHSNVIHRVFLIGARSVTMTRYQVPFSPMFLAILQYIVD